jgi:hypothetical protein
MHLAIPSPNWTDEFRAASLAARKVCIARFKRRDPKQNDGVTQKSIRRMQRQHDRLDRERRRGG